MRNSAIFPSFRPELITLNQIRHSQLVNARLSTGRMGRFGWAFKYLQREENTQFVRALDA